MTTHRRPGVLPLGNGPQAPLGDGLALWNEALDAKLQTGLPKAEAVKAIVKENPDLHAAYIAAHNARTGPSRYRGSTLD